MKQIMKTASVRRNRALAGAAIGAAAGGIGGYGQARLRGKEKDEARKQGLIGGALGGVAGGSAGWLTHKGTPNVSTPSAAPSGVQPSVGEKPKAHDRKKSLWQQRNEAKKRGMETAWGPDPSRLLPPGDGMKHHEVWGSKSKLGKERLQERYDSALSELRASKNLNPNRSEMEADYRSNLRRATRKSGDKDAMEQFYRWREARMDDNDKAYVTTPEKRLISARHALQDHIDNLPENIQKHRERVKRSQERNEQARKKEEKIMKWLHE